MIGRIGAALFGRSGRLPRTPADTLALRKVRFAAIEALHAGATYRETIEAAADAVADWDWLFVQNGDSL